MSTLYFPSKYMCLLPLLFLIFYSMNTSLTPQETSLLKNKIKNRDLESLAAYKRKLSLYSNPSVWRRVNSKSFKTRCVHSQKRVRIFTPEAVKSHSCAGWPLWSLI